MANLAKAVWFKDGNGNVCQLGNNAKIMNCKMAWVKDSNGNVYALFNGTPVSIQLISSNIGVQTLDFTKKDDHHFDVHLDTVFLPVMEQLNFKFCLKDENDNIVPITDGEISNTGDRGRYQEWSEGTSQDTTDGYFYFSVYVKKYSLNYSDYDTYITVTI